MSPANPGRRKICLKGGYVWPGGTDRAAPGGLLIDGDTVIGSLSPAEAEQAAGFADEVIDTSGMLLMPPLLDCHVHSSSSLFRGTENSLPLELWSYYAINYGRGLADEAVRQAVLLTDIEMIRNGIGGIVDHFPQSGRAAIALAAHRQAGLRVGFAPFFSDLLDEDILDIPLDRRIISRIAPTAPRAPDAIRAAYHELHADIRSSGDGRIALLAGPNSPQRASDALWQLWDGLRQELGIGSHTHLLETWPQAKAARRRWPEGLITALDEGGFLDTGLSVAHAIWLTPEERAILAARGVTITSNPISNGMLGSGRKNLPDDLAAGLKIALGTDSSNTGGRHDVFEAMRHMLVSGRDPGTDFRLWLSPADVLRAATQTGASAVGGRCSGRIAPGGPADILFLDVESFGLAAAPVSLNTVVVHADPRNVHSLMVDGRWLMRDRVVVTVDEVSLTRSAAELAVEVRSAADDMTAELRSLHPPYLEWQSQAFAGQCCPGCVPTSET